MGGASERPSAEAAYRAAQTLRRRESGASAEELGAREDNWKDPAIPALQRGGVEIQLENLRQGTVDPVFASLGRALAAVELPRFTLLDAACASGYYREVIATLDRRPIEYMGCDYSPAMIELARAKAPDGRFEVQDLTRLSYPDRSFDVVLVSGVLEHVPRFAEAIAQVCRVARSHVIAHRVPLRRWGGHRFTLGSQYNIETPRIYFARATLLQEFRARGFEPIREADTYERAGVAARLRRPLRRHTIRTLVFERVEPPTFRAS
jgi:SAM-dependent methyltransferase